MTFFTGTLTTWFTSLSQQDLATTWKRMSQTIVSVWIQVLLGSFLASLDNLVICYSVCENMNGWWVHLWQKYIYEKHGLYHFLIYKKAKFNLKMPTRCQLCLPTKRKELCFFSPGHIPLRHLVYRVHALPGSMRPLIWDFGQLNHQVESLYTNQIVSRYVSTWNVLLLLCLWRTN